MLNWLISISPLVKILLLTAHFQKTLTKYNKSLQFETRIFDKLRLMKEQDLIKIIKEQTKSEFLGDDCAYLKEFGIVVTQDNFIEDAHFKQEWATPYQIGYKAAAVNISDILASGAKPEYITIGLSMPDLGENFVKEFYSGIESGSYGAKVIGGDITGADKVFVSITAIGSAKGRKISSRKNAKAGYVVVSRGKYGESSKGFQELQEGIRETEAIKAHLEPKLDVEFSKNIAENIKEDYAMMDTSDGLADALFQIAKTSGVTIKTNYIEGMFGAEDYHLVAAVPKWENKEDIIAYVYPFDGAYLQIGDKKYLDYDELGLYKHWS